MADEKDTRGELTALIDGDTIAFLAASACQHKVVSPDGTVEFFARMPEGEAAVDNMIQRVHDRLGATHIKVFLSCSPASNWRLKVDPTYKSNRNYSVRPLILEHLKNYLRNKYGAEHWAGLEADDAIGLHATDPKLVPGETIIVGRDKDFKTIPGRHYQLKDDREDGAPNIRVVSPLEASLSHYAQVLTGDAVDGYEGCPGIGPKRALRIIEAPVKLVPKGGVITRGTNKGQSVTKWHEGASCSVWEAIVCAYERAGKTEADAIRTARLARILLAGDYDFETHTVRLWVPDLSV